MNKQSSDHWSYGRDDASSTCTSEDINPIHRTLPSDGSWKISFEDMTQIQFLRTMVLPPCNRSISTKGTAQLCLLTLYVIISYQMSLVSSVSSYLEMHYSSFVAISSSTTGQAALLWEPCPVALRQHDVVHGTDQPINGRMVRSYVSKSPGRRDGASQEMVTK